LQSRAQRIEHGKESLRNYAEHFNSRDFQA
jgi:hypothetical protein